MEKLTIQYVKIVRYGNRRYLWVNLITETETRRCCYTRYNGIWQHEGGNKEPAMSETLRDRFHGKIGQSALNDCYKKCTETTIGVVDFENK